MAEADAGLELPIGLTEQKFLQQLARIEAKALKSSKAMQQGFVKANADVSRSFGQMSGAARGQLQNVSYQLQDIFVQISSGTDAARALGQQLPQLFSGFGAIGAALGLAASAAIPLAAHFLKSGEGAEDLQKHLDRLKGALSDYKATIDSALAPMEQLWGKFGEGAQAARETYAAMLEIQKITYLQEMSATVGGLTEKLNGVSEAMQRWNEASYLPEALRADAVNLMSQEVEKLASEFGLTLVQAKGLSDALAAMAAAKDAGPAAMAEAAANLADEIMRAREEGAELPAHMLEAAKQAYELSQEAREAAFVMGDVADGALTAADAAAAATDQTNAWAAAMSGVRAEIGAIASALSQMGGGMIANASKFVELNALRQGKSVAEAAQARQKAQMEAEFTARELAAGSWVEKLAIKAERGLTAKGMELDAELDTARTDARESAKAAAKAAGGGGGRKRGGGGGGRAKREEPSLFENAEKELTDLQRQIDLIGKSTVETAKMRAEWAMLDEAKRRGVPVNDQLNTQIEAQAEQVGKLTGELEAAELAQDQFDQAIEGIANAFSNAILEGENLRDSLANIFKQIAANILNAGIQNALQTAFSGAGQGGGFWGLLAGAFGGTKASVPGYASGGTHRGGLRIVGENGPELEATGPSRIFNAAQTAQILSGAKDSSSGGRIQMSASELTLTDDGRIMATVNARIVQGSRETVGHSVAATRKSIGKSKMGWGI